jgi:3-oxoacid CoA-transferase subunit A
MIFLTGDTHRDFYRIFEFCEENELKEDDILIILGDAGINYYLNEWLFFLQSSEKYL